MVQDEWGAPVDPNKVEAALEKYPNAKALAFVHAETSTGACSDAKTLAALAQKDVLTIVDTVTNPRRCSSRRRRLGSGCRLFWLAKMFELYPGIVTHYIF